VSNDLASRQKMARRKKLQGALSVTTSTLGLTALGSKGGGMALRRVAQSPKMVAHSARALKVADKMDKATVPLLTTGAGIGGVGGFNFAAIQRAEAAREKRKKDPVSKKKDKLTPGERKSRRWAAGMGAAVGGGTTAAVGGLAARSMTEKPWVLPGDEKWGIKPLKVDDGGVGYRVSEHFRKKGTRQQEGWKVKPTPGTPGDPGHPGSPGRPPKYEETIKTNDPKVKLRYERIKTSAERESTDAARAAFKEKVQQMHAKYGSEKRVTDPGSPGTPPRPARPGTPGKPGVPNWREPTKAGKFAHKVFGGPKRTTGILIGGATVAGAGLGAGYAVGMERGLRKERRKDRKRIAELAKGYTMTESAFGVQISKRSGPEDEYEKYNRAAEKGKGIFQPGEADPDDWKDMPTGGETPKPKRRAYPQSGGIDPERRRLKRLDRYQTAATAGSVAAGGVAAGALAAKPAYKKVREASKKTIRRKGGAYGFVKPKQPEPTTGQKAARVAHKTVATTLRKVPQLRKIPTGKTAIGAGAASAALAAAAVGVNHHRKNKGRSYADWWDG